LVGAVHLGGREKRVFWRIYRKESKNSEACGQKWAGSFVMALLLGDFLPEKSGNGEYFPGLPSARRVRHLGAREREQALDSSRWTRR